MTSTQVNADYGDIDYYRTVSKHKDHSYFVAEQVILPTKLVQAELKVRQKFLLDLFLKEVKGKLAEEKKITVDGLSGAEYLIDTPDGLARCRLLSSGEHMFLIAFVGQKGQVQSKHGDMFFNSFKLMKPKADGGGKSP